MLFTNVKLYPVLLYCSEINNHNFFFSQVLNL